MLIFLGFLIVIALFFLGGLMYDKANQVKGVIPEEDYSQSLRFNSKLTRVFLFGPYEYGKVAYELKQYALLIFPVIYYLLLLALIIILVIGNAAR